MTMLTSVRLTALITKRVFGLWLLRMFQILRMLWLRTLWLRVL